MAVIVTYEDMTTLVPNTTMQKKLFDGVLQSYTIDPIDGYVLHHNSRDYSDVNPETMETTFKLGYSASATTVHKTYDFDATTTIDGYTAYGRFELFARPASEVPADQIFGVNPDHEVM